MPRIDLDTRKLIVHNWCTEKNISYRKLAKRYQVSPESVRNIITKYGNKCSVKDLPKFGRKKGASDPKLEAKIVRSISENPSMSIRDLAKKCRTSVNMIQRTRERNGLKTY